MKKLFILLLIFAGCATPPASTAFTPPPTSPGMDAADAEATLAVAKANHQATIGVVQRATAVSAQATTASGHATAQAITNATATAALAQEIREATSESLSVQATSQYLILEGTRQAQELAINGTRQAGAFEATRAAQARVATAENDLAIALQATREADAKLLEIELARKRAWSVWGPILAILLIGVLAIFGAVALYLYTQKENNMTVTVRHEGREITLVRQDGGLRMLPTRQPLQLTDGIVDADYEEVTAATTLPSSVPWDRLIRWTEPLRIPVGMRVDNGQPVLVDRKRTPHMAIVGTSGAGKTTSGLIPLITSLWGTGAHVLVLNGKGSDFQPFNSWRNYTAVSARDEMQMLEPTVNILHAMTREIQRRDQTMAQYSVRNWSEMPPHSSESGEILVAIDETLTLLDAAKAAADIAKYEGDEAQLEHVNYMIVQFWRLWRQITAQSRKYGIYMVCTFTDATRDAIGREGMVLLRQMARIAYRMNSSPASRALLDVDGNDGFPRGSAGLPNGRFIYNIGGDVGEAIPFYPNTRDLRNYHQVWDERVKDNPLPHGIASVIGSSPAQEPAYAPPRVNIEAPGQRVGEQLGDIISKCGSFNAVGRALYEGRDPSGQEINTIIRPALQWRSQNLSCEPSQAILSR